MSTAAGFNDLRSLHGLTRVLSERGASLAALVLIIALALDSALILSRLLSGPDTTAPASAPPLTAALPQNASNPQVLLATVINGHLFGAASAATGGANAPPTTMPLILAGVIAEKDPGKGEAIIGENAAAAKLYGVNAVIPGGARLHAVYRDRVLLERNGALETLALPRTPLSGAAPQSGAPLVPTAAALRENPALIGGLVNIQPVYTQGKLDGFRISPKGSNGTTAFQRLGLKPGDLIIAVNGTTLDDPARAMAVVQTLSSSGSATITVSRNGTAQEVNLNLADLNGINPAGDGTPGATQTPNPEPAAAPFALRRRHNST